MSRLNWDSDRHRSPSRNSPLVGDDEPVHSKHGESHRKPSQRKPRSATGAKRSAAAVDPLRERVSSETKLGGTKIAIEKLRMGPSADLADAAQEILGRELAESRSKLEGSGLGRNKTKSMRRELDDLAWDLDEEIESLRPD